MLYPIWLKTLPLKAQRALFFITKSVCVHNEHEKSSFTMASKAARIAAVANQIFGTVPNRGARTGLQYLKKPLTGAYEARYYMEPIEPIARKVCSIFFNVVLWFCFFPMIKSGQI